MTDWNQSGRISLRTDKSEIALSGWKNDGGSSSSFWADDRSLRTRSADKDLCKGAQPQDELTVETATQRSEMRDGTLLLPASRD
jgi:hypothetical protein